MIRSKIFRAVLASIFFLSFAAPMTASALEKAAITFEFHEEMSDDSRVDYLENKFNDYVESELTGVIAGGVDHAWFVLEGDGAALDQEIEELQVADQSQNVEVIHRETLAQPTWDEMRSHTEFDERDHVSATVSSELKRSYIRVDFEDGTSEQEKKTTLDEYFQGFSADGLGGIAISGGGHDWISGGGHDWMPIAIEGQQGKVNSAINELQSDERFDSVDVLRSYEPVEQSLFHLWSHSEDDVHQTTK